MSSRYNAKEGAGGKANLGYQEGEEVSGLSIPSCTIEDVDRSVFNLFEKDLDFTVKGNKKPIKIPVIFATGERFAILARKKPLRDSTDTLILPLISIMRTGVQHQPGVAENVPIVIKKRLAPEDAVFQQYINKQGILNDENLAKGKRLDTEDGASESGVKKLKSGISSAGLNNPLIENSIGTNVFEVFEIPPIKHYIANYEITFWCQYTQQMNQVMTILMGGYTNNNRASFKLETDKGYYFSAFVEDGLTPDVNFDDFTENERIVKCTISMKVNAYLVAPRSIGQPTPVRRYVSAPHISFTMHTTVDPVASELNPRVNSGNANDYVLDNLESDSDKNPKQGVGGTVKGKNLQNKDSLGTTTLNNNIGSSGDLVEIKKVDPTTGQIRTIQVRVIDQNRKSGETVIKAKGFVMKLDDLIRK
tara:strand:- start:607 stop:1863 length:1257 start_codon:yes stop_codon:yes gene_type:complete